MARTACAGRAIEVAQATFAGLRSGPVLPVEAGATVQRVEAVATLQVVVAVAAVDVVVAILTVQLVVAVAAVDVVVARPGMDDVVAVAAVDLIVAGATIDVVAPVAAAQEVAAASTVDVVVAAAPEDDVVARTAVQVVVARATDHHVVARAAVGVDADLHVAVDPQCVVATAEVELRVLELGFGHVLLLAVDVDFVQAEQPGQAIGLGDVDGVVAATGVDGVGRAAAGRNEHGVLLGCWEGLR